MSERQKAYPFDEIEARWQRHWELNQTFHAPGPGEPGFDPAKPKRYVLDMFPYPSGDGLHVGHVEGYTATDIVSRFWRKRGFNVLHPMGWDAFGLPAEQYAIKTGQHPRVTTERNCGRFREQLKRVGFSYDWQREVDTTDPGYFKWTQWIFLQLYEAYFDETTQTARPIAELEKQRDPRMSDADWRAFVDGKRLAYVAEVPVNWCPQLGTVLANEEVKDGKSEVGGFPVERRPMRQWMLRITAYAERLIDELKDVDWSEGIKAMQREWIGRSEGAEVDFKLDGRDDALRVFTTRPDTLFGATYMVLSPEHPLVMDLASAEQRAAVEAYRQAVGSKSDLERTADTKDKTGVFTGAFAINPVNAERIPIWIADYVLMGYGTGAIMAVPGHDTRDFEFAEKFGLPITQVVQAPEGVDWRGFVDDGVSVNSANAEITLTGLPTQEAKRKITAWLESKGLGKKTINYKLRDWLFARQRYWGEPFPIVWESGQEQCGAGFQPASHQAVPESELPVLPPELDDFKPTGTPDPPLSKAIDWVRYSESSRRETNTMPQWAGSCWYYLRFTDARNSGRFASAEAERYWLHDGVDLYVGGAEHAVLHLLYARFWHKVLFDLGYVSAREPFRRLVNQGLILGPDSQKMSKSRGNVVNPDDVIANYGADSLRLYEMFMGPLEQVKPWSERGVEGLYRFLARVWRLFMDEQDQLSAAVQDLPSEGEPERVLHETIKKVTEDTDKLAFNTAIAQMMVFTKTYTALEVRPAKALATFLHLLNPYAPHLAEELWAKLAERFPSVASGELALAPWPAYDEAILQREEIEIVVQVNGKLRDRIKVPADADEETVKTAAKESKAKDHLTGEIVKVIVVPKKLVNIVVR